MAEELFQNGRLLVNKAGLRNYNVRWEKGKSIEPKKYLIDRNRENAISLRYSVVPLFRGGRMIELSNLHVPPGVRLSTLDAFLKVFNHFDARFKISKGASQLALLPTWLLTDPHYRERFERRIGGMGLRLEQIDTPVPRTESEYLKLLNKAHSDFSLKLKRALKKKGRDGFYLEVRERLGEAGMEKLEHIRARVGSALRRYGKNRTRLVTRDLSSIAKTTGIPALALAYGPLFIQHKLVRK